MKKTLIKEISRLKSLMSILNENTDNKIAVLIDGTSSAGKSMTAKLLNAVPFYESKDPNQWVVIDSDHFSDDAKDGKGEERRLNFDHPNIRDWAKDNDSGIVSGLYRKTDESVPETLMKMNILKVLMQGIGIWRKNIKRVLGRELYLMI